MPLRLTAVAAALIGSAEARLGSPAVDWEQGRQTLGDGQGLQNFGYEYYASTTVYGDTPMSACGELDTRELVSGTEYFAVASAQSMQPDFPQGPQYGGCGWKCQLRDGTPVDRCNYTHPPGTMSGSTTVDGCSCVQTGTCMCGQAGNGTAAANGTARMGCFTCGRGRFVRRTPYALDDNTTNELMGEEIKVVVADVCPYGPNSKWCPARPGEANAVDVENHLDFATRPAVEGFNNNFFVFTPEACPELLERRMQSKTTCPASTWPDA